jgi:hypothetical protein
MNKSWIFGTQIPAILRIHLTTKGKSDIIREKTLTVDQTLYFYRLKKAISKFIPVTESYYLKASISDSLHGHSCNKFVALRPDFFEKLVSQAEQFSATSSSRLVFEIELH